MGLSATFKKDSQRFEITLRRNGNRIRRLAPVGMGKREALQRIGDELVHEMETKAEVEVEAAQPPTLWHFCAEVYNEKHGVSPRTWSKRKYKVMGIMADLGEYRLPDLTTRIVTDWLELLQCDGAPLKKGGRGQPLEEGSSALNDYLVALKAIYRVAIENDFIDRLPFRNKLASIDLTTDREAWSPAMKERFLATAGEMDSGIRNLGEFLMLTGCRPVEALRLRWNHVQTWPSPRVTITGKGYRFRKLPLIGPLARLLDGLERVGEAVFPVENGRTAGERYKFWPYRRWEAVCDAAGVPSVAYDLRHTFITELVAKGVYLPKVAKWCGNSVRVIEERYSHLSPEFLMDVADNVTQMDRAHAPQVVSGDAEGQVDDDVAALE